jgi:hypothetical protein
MSFSRSKCLILSIVSAPLVACGADKMNATPSTDAPPGIADAGPTDGSPDARISQCATYPIPWDADPDADDAAAAELAGLSANATMEWNDNTGTFKTIFKLDQTLACPPGEDSGAKVLAVLAAHPKLFPLDLDEWLVPPPYNCEFVPKFGETLTMGRTKLANHTLGRDILAYTIKHVVDQNDVPTEDIVLTSVIATFVPVGIPGLDQAMTQCSDVDEAAVIAAIRARTLTASTFDLCVPTGSVPYTPHENDRVAFLPGDTWTWGEGTGQVLLTGTRTVRVTLAPANYTPQLLLSDARCPVLDPDSEDFTVGFDITVDIHTGEILFVKPGLDCVVC